jgi:uncharacterized protein YcfL
MKLKYLSLLIILILIGCRSGITEEMNEEQIRKLAWTSFEESERSSIVGSKEDIHYEDKNNSGVTTIINNASSDVWKEAEIEYLNEDQIKGVSQRLEVKTVSNRIAKVSFKTLAGESLNMPYTPIRIYVDVKQAVVIGREDGNISGDIQFYEIESGG